jgi:hypothetical protein
VAVVIDKRYQTPRDSWLVRQAWGALPVAKIVTVQKFKAFEECERACSVASEPPTLQNRGRRNQLKAADHKMASIKRSLDSDPLQASISSKVYVRSTKSGKVQKIVREVYLRQDIPCSSKLCNACQKTAPTDSAGRREYLLLSWPLKVEC